MISIIVPTYNESKNLTRLVPELYKILRGLKVKFEILIVDDDSPDKTWQVAKKYSAYNVKVIRRKGDRGLSSAVIEGFNKAKGEIFIVMDADLSHPPKLIPKMLNASRNHDLVLASRYIGSGRAKFSLYRKLVSFGAKLLSRPLINISDPMSGYFLVKKGVIKGVSLKPRGYKILLEILVKGHNSKSIGEVPFVFEKRLYGKSKLGFKVCIDYLRQILSLYLYRLFKS